MNAPRPPDVALSIRQPWAELIMSGRKTIELRTWDTPHRGRLWIQAGRFVDAALDARFGFVSPVRGAYVGCVDLVSIVEVDAMRWERWRDQHLDGGSYHPGFLAWTFEHPRRLREPIAASGRQGIYPIEPEMARRLEAALV